MSKERIQQTGIGLLASLRVLYERAREHAGVCKAAKVAGLVLLAALILVLDGYVGARIGQKKALETYNGWMEAYRVERMAIDQAAATADPYEVKLRAEAESIARALYGIRDNSKDDMRTYCWCILNRVDSRDYPDTVEGVVNQPDQWVRYSQDNPVLENLYQLAREQVDAWHSLHRPVSPDFVYAGWSRDDVVLRDRWEAGASTKYWRFGQ